MPPEPDMTNRRRMRIGASVALLAAALIAGFHLFAHSHGPSYTPNELWSRIESGAPFFRARSDGTILMFPI